MRILFKASNICDPVAGRQAGFFVVENGRFSRCVFGVDRVEKIDGYVYPGFIDSHAHLLGTGLKIVNHSLEGLRSIDEIVEVASRTDAMVLRGWNEELLGRYPTSEDLDRVNHPLIVIRRCGHVGVANKRFLKMFGLESDDGVLKEASLSQALNSIPIDVNEMRKALKAGEKEFFKHGVTTVHSDDMYRIPSDVVKDLISEATIDVYEHYHIHTIDDLKEVLSAHPRSVKILVDGSLGARTAYLRSQYSDGLTRGILNFSPEELEKIVHESNRMGIQVVAHVIGDGALDVALRAFKGTEPALRHRLVHVQIAWPEQIEKIKVLKFCVDVQPQFFISDEKMAFERLRERINHAYPFKALVESEIHVAFSSDSPVEFPNPLEGIKAAKKLGIKVEDSLKAYTVEGAYQEFMENEKGRFEDGMVADFVVLSKPVDDESAEVIATYKCGKRVWGNCTYASKV